MATAYRGWSETRRERDDSMRGSVAVHYKDVPVRMHAVAVEDGVPSDVTVCGMRVVGDLAQDWDATWLKGRCSRCADALGSPYV